MLVAVETAKTTYNHLTNDWFDRLPQVCCICLSKYANKDELRQFPCSHFFHKRCIDKWMKINELCPLCKGKVNKDVLRDQIKLSWKEPDRAFWTRVAGYVLWGKNQLSQILKAN